ncbi:MAG: protein kinase [Candidatus Sericytochromatia bacterium]|nr:protein kinase [Candidatus Sericytochromatia bacterium]
MCPLLLEFKPLRPGDLIANRFRIIDELGTGAMGVVWLVEDVDSGQRVALKRVADQLGEDGALRFKQEFRLMTQLRHPNCCRVHEYGQFEDGTPFFTMEVVPGKGLDELIPMSEADVKKILPNLLAALGHVHDLGFVHRDLKSVNVRITPDGTLKLMDFGLIEYAGSSDLPITGTLGYVAPEIVQRSVVDGRADLYAVGILVFELLTGRLPFEYASRAEILKAHVGELAPRLSSVMPDCDPTVDNLVAKLLAKTPAERYSTAADVMLALGFEAGRAGRSLLAPPLVGRQAVTQTLGDAVRELKNAQRGTTLVLEGPPGIGKSRILREFRASLQVEGETPVVTGTARGEDSTPYAPFREVLRGLVPTLNEYVPEILSAQANLLSSLLPELSSEGAPPLEDASKEKLRLMGAVVELFGRLANRKGFVVILEDWHAADPLSRELLEFLQRNLADAPTVFAISTRSAPAAAPSGASQDVRMPIGPLAFEDIREILNRMLAIATVPTQWVETLNQLAEGNPFHVERLLEYLVREKVVQPTFAGWNTDTPIDPARLPRNLQGLLLRKLSELPEDAITVARVVAVLARGFDRPLLQELTGFPDDRLFEALDALQRQQILFQNDDKAYEWTQALFKEVVYESFTPEHRTAMHAKVAGALERRIGRTQLREAPFELVKAVADHYIIGCRPDKIVTFAIEVGRRSAALFANREAERYLSTALTLLKASDDPKQDKPRLLSLRLLGDSRLLSGDVSGAKSCYSEAIPIAQRLRATNFLARMLTALADCYTSEDNLADALACCERSLQVSLDSGDRASAAKSYFTSAALRYMQGNLADALSQAQEAMRFSQDANDMASLGEAQAFLGHLLVASFPEKTNEGITHLREAIATLTDLGHKMGLLNALNLLGAAYFKTGEFERAQESFLANRKIAFELGLREEEAFAHLNLAITNYELGDFESGLIEAEIAHTISAESNLSLAMALAVTFRAPGLLHLGRVGEAIAMANEAMALFKQSNNKVLEARVLEHRVRLMLHLGRTEEAWEISENLLTLLEQTGNTDPVAQVRALRGEAKAYLGHYAEAESDLQAAWEQAALGNAQGLQVQIHRCRAWLALRQGKHECAGEEIEKGITLGKKIGAKLLEAELENLRGEVFLAAGDARAIETFGQVTRLGEALKSPLLRALGCFGQAASRPYDEGAQAKATQAHKLITAMLTGLDHAAIEAFWKPLERQRILKGNYIDLSLVRRRQPSQQPPRGLPFGLNKL